MDIEGKYLCFFSFSHFAAQWLYFIVCEKLLLVKWWIGQWGADGSPEAPRLPGEGDEQVLRVMVVVDAQQ